MVWVSYRFRDFRMGVTNVIPQKTQTGYAKFCSRISSNKSDSGGTDRFLLPSEQTIFASCIKNPPGYEGGSETYPVFYLLHGGGDDDSGWSTIGRAGFILDNLIATRKAVSMIVVMPNGRLPRPAGMSAGRLPRQNVAALETL